MLTSYYLVTYIRCWLIISVGKFQCHFAMKLFSKIIWIADFFPNLSIPNNLELLFAECWNVILSKNKNREALLTAGNPILLKTIFVFYLVVARIIIFFLMCFSLEVLIVQSTVHLIYDMACSFKKSFQMLHVHSSLDSSVNLLKLILPSVIWNCYQLFYLASMFLWPVNCFTLMHLEIHRALKLPDPKICRTCKLCFNQLICHFSQFPRVRTEHL